jgi:hypothetical protein
LTELPQTLVVAIRLPLLKSVIRKHRFVYKFFDTYLHMLLFIRNLLPNKKPLCSNDIF